MSGLSHAEVVSLIKRAGSSLRLQVARPVSDQPPSRRSSAVLEAASTQEETQEDETV